jgi:hypothetical protein
MEYFDFIHKRTIFPINKKASASKFGAFITFSVGIFIIVFIIITEIKNYENHNTVSYTHGFVENIEDSYQKVTLGIKLNEDWINYVKMEFFNSFNEKINDDLIKRCDENLNEIKENKKNTDNYICFINYPLAGSNITNHIIKIRLIKNDNETSHPIGRIPFYIKFKDTLIDHERKNPFVIPESVHKYTYFYDLNFTTSIRKYIRIIDYKTELYFHCLDFWNKNVYLEDYEDSSKTESQIINNETIIGAFRFQLSKKTDIFIRKYPYITDILSKIGGLYSLLSLFLPIIDILFLKSNDNLRIYNSFMEKKPKYLRDESIDIIEKYYNDKKKEKEEDFCCCKCCYCKCCFKTSYWCALCNICYDNKYSKDCQQKCDCNCCDCCQCQCWDCWNKEDCCFHCIEEIKCNCLDCCLCKILEYCVKLCLKLCFCQYQICKCGYCCNCCKCCECCFWCKTKTKEKKYTITCWDKWFFPLRFLMCCCKNNREKNEFLYAVNEYMNEQLTIENYLELQLNDDIIKRNNENQFLKNNEKVHGENQTMENSYNEKQIEMISNSLPENENNNIINEE